MLILPCSYFSTGKKRKCRTAPSQPQPTQIPTHRRVPIRHATEEGSLQSESSLKGRLQC